MHRIATALVATLAAATLLAACSDGDAATPGPTPSVSPFPGSPSPTPTPDASLTVAPRGETAKQFIRRWVALGDDMQRTGETKAFLAAAGAECAACRTYATTVSDIYAAGGSITVANSTVTKAVVDSGSRWTVSITAAPATFTERRGAQAQRKRGGPYRLQLIIGKVRGKWLVATYVNLP